MNSEQPTELNGGGSVEARPASGGRGLRGVRGPKDPGGKPWGALAWVAMLVLLGVVIWVQQRGVMQQAEHADAAARASAQATIPGLDMGTEWMGRFFLKFSDVIGDAGQASVEFGNFVEDAGAQGVAQREGIAQRSRGEMLRADPSLALRGAMFRYAMAGPVKAATGGATSGADGGMTPQHQEALERVREIIALLEAEPVAGELARWREATARAALLGDARDIERVMAAGSFEAIDSAARARLEKHHGFLGRATNATGVDRADASVSGLFGGGVVLALLVMVPLVALALGTLAGVVLLLVGAVGSASGWIKSRFVAPSPGGSVMIETVAVFMASFMLLKGFLAVLAAVMGKGSESTVVGVALVAQWAVLPTVLWPLLRGVSWSELRRLYGWHGTRRSSDAGAEGLGGGGVVGVLREVVAGVVGYVACLPLLVLGVAVSLVVVLVQGMLRQMSGEGPGAPPTNPIVELLGEMSGWHVVMLVLLATVWAPLVEETIMRGALFRQLRGRLAWWGAAILSAIVFAFMHGYPVLLLGPVLMLGFGFAMLREWRGSLIAPITAHALHNATIMLVLVGVMSSMG